MQRVEFVTKDGVTIVGAYRSGPPDSPCALLLHMMPATKESWEPLAEKLEADGLTSLAIDFRGHGESVQGKGGEMLDYKAFSEEQHQQKASDIAAAARWLEERGIELIQIALVGASIGANLAIRFAADHPGIPAVVALSPSLDYHGVTTADAAALIPRACRLLLAASDEDTQSFGAIDALEAVAPHAESRRLQGAGHGNTILEKEPGFLEYVALWIGQNVSRPHD